MGATATAGRKRAKRRGPKHPGVVLIPPDPTTRAGWRARYKDPDAGKFRKVTLPEIEAATPEGRAAWAVRKSKELVVRRAQIEGGATRITRTGLEKAIESYYETEQHRLRPSTTALYKMASNAFTEWAKARGIRDSADIRAEKLPGFRDSLVRGKRPAYVTGGTRGERAEGTDRPSPQTINWKLRAVKTILNWMRMRGLVPLTSDQITDALKPVPVPREQAEFLRPAELQKLLDAALAHDADVFVMTREEKEGLREAGSTAKHEPIAPFVALTLLTGMRLNEALSLRWDAVDLEAINADGERVGEIRLKADDTKTAHARTVGLEITPGLRALLAAMRLRAPKARYVFGDSEPWGKAYVEAARKRLVRTYGAPRGYSWQLLRSSAATYQCNAPGLFGDAAAFRSAKRLGHSIVVSEKHYAGLVSVSREARTLEAAMQVVTQVSRVVERVSVPKARRARAAAL